MQVLFTCEEMPTFTHNRENSVNNVHYKSIHSIQFYQIGVQVNRLSMFSTFIEIFKFP